MGDDPDYDAKLPAEKKNGVYLLSIDTVYDGLIVDSGGGHALVEGVRVNGNYVHGDWEMECDDFEIRDAVLEVYIDQADYRP